MRNWELRAMVVRRARELDLSLTEVAERASITRPYLYKLMDGETRDPGIATLHRLARALDLAPVMLFRYFIDAQSVPRGGVMAFRSPFNDGIRVAFGSDVTIPDYAPVAPGEPFTKIWSIQNVGALTWRDYRLVRADAELVIARRNDAGELEALLDAHLQSETAELPIPDTAPGHSAAIAVDLIAPSESCTVASLWRIVDAEGRFVFPPEFFLQVIVTVIGA